MRIRQRLSKKGKTVWEAVTARGKVLKTFASEAELKKYVEKKLRMLESWPPPAKELVNDEDWERAEAIASQRNSWESWNFAVAKWRGLLQTDELAAHLGVSESWVRKNFVYTEWHHSYKQKGDGGKAFFYDPASVLNQIAADAGLRRRLEKLSFKTYADLCALVGREAALDNLGWRRELSQRGGLQSGQPC